MIILLAFVLSVIAFFIMGSFTSTIDIQIVIAFITFFGIVQSGQLLNIRMALRKSDNNKASTDKTEE